MARSIELETTINAQADAVWRAVSDAQELSRWFPLSAEVDLRAGGKATFRWGDTYPDMEGNILAVEHGKKLTVGAQFGAAGGEMITDYIIESRGDAAAALRIVQSGFPDGEQWDAMVDAVTTGWQCQFINLRYYLEHHQGQNRRVAWIVRPISLDPASAWERLSDSFALQEKTDQWQHSLADDLELKGHFELLQPGRQAVIALQPDRDLLRISIDPGPQGMTAGIFLSSWRKDQRTLLDMEPALKAALAAALEG